MGVSAFNSSGGVIFAIVTRLWELVQLLLTTHGDEVINCSTELYRLHGIGILVSLGDKVSFEGFVRVFKFDFES